MTVQSPLISVTELAQILPDKNVRVLDCRFQLLDPAAGYRAFQAGHIPGAVYADLDRDLAGPVAADSGRHPLPAVAAVEDFLGRAGIDNDTRVLVYDDNSGAIAARAWWLLHWLGHRETALLNGGLQAWSDDGRPLESRETRPDTVAFRGAPQAELVVSTGEVERALEAGKILVDARSTSRFQGDEEPIDAVAGHIPGTVSMPFERSLTPAGRWRPASELRREWDATLAGRASGPWGVMCGSGVTACHLALSASLAGLPLPRLYAGSWSEWIRDPARPVATGPGRPRAAERA